ncbi:MAG TPA: indolepyruvate ferredoxin oxidoreductase family protein [Rhodocyclaceae bacterium]|nr:indolepyruvate ferredoxin oxidoreductase family protein [Rhodocyclaceae bacterium]
MGGFDLTRASLEDKYLLSGTRVYLTGNEALARLPMLQRERDLAAGLNTAGYISGYRGSPLSGLDQTLWKAKKHLATHHIVFRPGINEDLSATAVWGTQQLALDHRRRYDGVFAMWYGKGPGVDRCGDVFHHANGAGTSLAVGVLAIAGDDHAAKSSTFPHQSDHYFKAMMMPVLAPANIQDYLDLGLHGFALSRYSGCWVGFKAVTDTVETSASVDVDPHRVVIMTPDDFDMPPGGLNIRWPDPWHGQEERLLNFKLYAALAYCRANKLNRIIWDSPRARFGIITSGKAYLDVRQALYDLGIDERVAADIGIRLYKVGMVWPLEAEGVRRFAEGLEEILVVEEKRQLIEYQLKEELYNWRDDVRPRVVGKFDEKGEWAFQTTPAGKVWHGEWLLPAAGDLNPGVIARALSARIGHFYRSEKMDTQLALLDAKAKQRAGTIVPLSRTPYFCPGCPHNTSTKVPEGSRALAGIGCHFMATWMNRNTSTFTHMGAEGVTWLGQAPFTDTPHVFVNLGDGTYFHSGILAIRQAVSAGVPITYKILYNDAVAMTGGQPVDGTLSVPDLVAQVLAEGVHKLVLVTDGTERAYGRADLPHGIEMRHRDDMDAIQRELREYPGVSVIVYDQTCAAEKRRRRKRGTFPDPARRLFINDRVCEGCGDCGVQSNCLAVVPLETEFGRKRAIDQSACNKDFSCRKGFCPSFIEIEGGRLRRGQALELGGERLPDLPEPALPETAQPFNLLISGIGGTGVITIGALVGMAAHLEGKSVQGLDMTGLAQKGGAVFSHLRVCDDREQLFSVRVGVGEAHAVIGGDIVVASGAESLAAMRPGRTRAVVSCALSPTAEFTQDPNWQFPTERMQSMVREATADQADFFDAGKLARQLVGDAIASNLLLLGFAWQKGLVPVGLAALLRAIELNAVSVEMNKQAFEWGRRMAAQPDLVERLTTPPAAVVPLKAQTLDAMIATRVQDLIDYQDAAYASRYQRLVERVRTAEAKFGGEALTRAVARYAHKLMAYKDEYEVARLMTDPALKAKLEQAFEGDYTLSFYLAPPLLASIDPATGLPRKRRYGPRMMSAFKWLARMRRLRGSFWDVFGHTAERRRERQLIADYEADIDWLLGRLGADRMELAERFASWPEDVRGYGHIKLASIDKTLARRAQYRTELEKLAGGNVRVAA